MRTAINRPQPIELESRRDLLLTWGGIVVVAAAAVAAGLAIGGNSKAAVVLPVGLVVGLGMVAVALSRFEVFVLGLVGIRAALDAAKLGTSVPGLDPAGVLSLLFIVAGGAWLIVQRRTEPAPESHPLAPALVAFLAAGILSLPLSRDVQITVVQLFRLTSVVVLLLVLNRVLADERRIRWFLGAFFASGVVPILAALYQKATGTGFHVSGSFDRVQGTFAHPNPFAIYLTFVIVLGAAVYRHLGQTARGLLALVILGSTAALFLTYTRSAWIATALGLLIVGLLHSRRLLLGVLIAMAVAVVAVPSVQARFSDLSQQTTISGAPGNSLTWRFAYWGQTLALASNPVTGIGLNSVQSLTTVDKEPHNDFVRVYVETGVIGLMAYLWMWGALGVTAWRVNRPRRRGLSGGLAAGFAGALGALLVLSVVSNVISQLVLLIYFMTLAALAVASVRIEAARPVRL